METASTLKADGVSFRRRHFLPKMPPRQIRDRGPRLASPRRYMHYVRVTYYYNAVLRKCGRFHDRREGRGKRHVHRRLRWAGGG